MKPVLEEIARNPRDGRIYHSGSFVRTPPRRFRY